MIPKDKYDIIGFWFSQNVLGWKYTLSRINSEYRSGPTLKRESSFNPCVDLNDCKLLIDALTNLQYENWYKELTEDTAMSYVAINASADIRTEALIRVFFPNMSIEEAINKITDWYHNFFLK